MKGRNESNKQAVIYLLFIIAYMPILKNNANKGSVSPEWLKMKYKGEQIKIIAPIIAFLISSFSIILKVIKMVNIDTITLNSLMPLNPNWAKGQANNTKTGFAQWLKNRWGWVGAYFAYR